MDNALEAAEKTEDGRYVECRMYMGNAGHFLVMEFCNGYVVPLLKDTRTVTGSDCTRLENWLKSMRELCEWRQENGSSLLS